VYEQLEDEQSRRVFRDVVSYKCSGKIDFLADCETPTADNWALLAPSPDKVYVDLGAYTGDTVLDYLSACGASCKPKASSCRTSPRDGRCTS